MTVRIGVITGLESEAAYLDAYAEGGGLRVSSVGANLPRARETALDMAKEGCAGLLSFGVAGALDPDLRAGTVILGSAVVDEEGRRWDTALDWRESLNRSLADDFAVVVAPIASSPTIVAGRAEKSRFRERTGASAVDMESCGVAQAAAEVGLPCSVLRVIADPQHRTIPPWVLGSISESGSLRAFKTVAGLLRRPWTLPVLISLARDYQAAMSTLRGVAVTIGPGVGFL